jgi:hypothetical protein
MRKGWAILLSAICLAGCSDPSKDRLPAGSRAVVIDTGGRSHILLGTTVESLPVGTEVIVSADEGDASDADRKVMVGVRSGPAEGRTGELSRSNLRPVK